MFEASLYLYVLPFLIALAFVAWLISLKQNNVTVVDSFWALFFLVATLVTFGQISQPSTRAYFVLMLVAIWSIRLSTYLHHRNHGKPEDRRYVAIRNRNEPNFRQKSLYLVFILQAVLAWIIFIPLHAALISKVAFNAIDILGIALWLLGLSFQVLADTQLSAFKSNPANQSKVLNTGVWGLSRHPNYFGESCIWFAYGLLAFAAGGWWAMISPIFMTYLLIKITGVKLLESDIAKRRPGYAEYMANTPAFFPNIFKVRR